MAEPIKDLFLEELGMMYSTEQQLLEAQQQLQKEATNQDLLAALNQHIEETGKHVSNLETVFNELDAKPQGDCKSIKALIDEGNQIISDAESDEAKDVAINAAITKAEAFETYCYINLLSTYQQVIGAGEGAGPAINLLNENLDEDRSALDLAVNSAPALVVAAINAAGEGQSA